MSPVKPLKLPNNPSFSSGPCAKPPGWCAARLERAFLGRSHRAPEGVQRLKRAIDRTKALLELPADFRVAIVPASDTGAFEMCLWSMLGVRPVTVLAWESFGKLWVRDVVGALRLADVEVREADFGRLPDLTGIDFERDVIFTANGTTSGVAIPDYEWVAHTRGGLTIVDGTSALFCQPVDWGRVDVMTFSWQKALGGEAQHGMVILGPRAVERLEAYEPAWPLPKLFRMTKGGALDEALFAGWTINTPSMLAVEDYLASLDWAESVGGLDGLLSRSRRNADVLYRWIERTPWVRNLALDRRTWSTSSVCLEFADPDVAAEPDAVRRELVDAIVRVLEAEGAAFDIASYRDAPPGLRVWTGPTVEAEDVDILTGWLDWAYAKCRAG